ncbi:prepilin-type N-terminal cleavage/methylation domain-containing protein [Cupriavidus respiraculi]|uniref:type IV pilin protein n=1 Tax=Cupriavidus respiraculi TaxID=195930 RepID=UPI001C95B401|nr:prepilin-type N-terminal cleavage/methylation domain-containing protein [Cupriavidus respiraculi]MBY4948879.1 prepilin-type N-terminal cleavage/methylation domain-containing protein [Cupriavidus respiraculi]
MNARRACGFTLLELIVALAILAILATVAVSTWQRHLWRGWRAQARSAMTAAMVDLERHAMSAMTFAADAGGETVAGAWPRAVPPTPARTRHLLFAKPCAQAGLATCVELHALPQAPDPDCGTLILRSTGEWLASPPGSAQAVPLPEAC